MIDIEDDSDESTEDSSTSGGPCAFWLPRCGDVSVLSVDIATKIAELTGCFLYPEPESRRWRIMHGKNDNAFRKLRNIEPLLEALAQHRIVAASTVNHNLISLTSQMPGTGTKYSQVANPPHRDRIMVHSDLEEHLEHMLVGEERIWNQNTSKYSTPENLLSAQMSQDNMTHASKIWTHFKTPAIGKPDNSIPRTPSGSNSVASSDKIRKPSSAVADQPNKFLPLQEQARLREWSKNVDRGADPAIAAEEPFEAEAAEEQANLSKRRVEDSDSDPEPSERAPDPEHQVQRVVAADSDDEVEADAALKMDRPVLGKLQVNPRQPIGIQNVDFGYINRAERKATPPQIANIKTKKVSHNIVSADTFFAGIPRDTGENDLDTAMQAKSGSQQGRIITSPIPTRSYQYSNKRNGFDGTADRSPETQHIDHGQPLSVNSLHHTTAELSSKNESGTVEPASPTYVPSGNFDPTIYGVSNRNRSGRQQKRGNHSHSDGQYSSGRQASRIAHLSPGIESSRTVTKQSRNYPDQQGSAEHRRTSTQPVPSTPCPNLHTGNAPNFRGAAASRRSRKDQLIDYEEDDFVRKGAIEPPPGLTSHSRTPRVEPEKPHALDSTSEDVCIPSIQPSEGRRLSCSEDISFSTSSSSGGLGQSLYDYVPQTKIIKPDVSHMRNDLIQQLRAVKAQEARTRSKAHPTHPQIERIEEDDEISTRKFHETMNLRGPNPGRGKNKVQTQETEAQKRARIAKVKEELQIEAMGSKARREPEKSEMSTQQDKLSTKAKQAARSNPIMANMHADQLQEAARRKCASELIRVMRPILGAARAYSGRLELEFQIGQLLVMPTSRLNTIKVYENDKWLNIFEKSGATVDVKFTNMLTNNGEDIDRILETRTKKWKTWSRETPGPTNVTVEFLCLDNLGQPFKLAMNADGSYRTTKDASVVGKVGIHCPGRVWDVCAVLTGSANWSDSSVAFEEDVREFVSTIYIKPELLTTVYFRPPVSNCLSVQDVVLKRVSFHKCQVPGEESLQLKITEVKTLKTRTHRTDTRLHVSHEMKHDAMAGEARVYYEVAITHLDVNHAFDDNRGLEAGELSETLNTGIFHPEQANMVVSAALRLVDKIDWVGSRNYGTLVQKQDEKIVREQQMAKTLPPSARNPTLIRPVQYPSGYSIADPRTVIGGTTTVETNLQTTTVAQPIHGIRANTYAQVWEDVDGNVFRVGQGGARIPVTLEDGHMNRAEVLPDDSASQIGGRSRTLRSMNAAGAYPNKPENFW